MSTSRLKNLLEVAELASAGVPLTDAQAGLYLQISPGTLSVWRCKKRGPKFLLVGTSPRYLKQDLDEWIASCNVQKKVSDKVGRPPKRRGGLR
jgi:hypothetical protein